jgi:hypothetical protein
MRRLTWVLAFWLAGCGAHLSYSARPGTAPRCAEGVCSEIVAFEARHGAIGMWLDTPSGTMLRSARFAFDRDPPCGGGVPVVWVRVGPTVLRWGPAEVGGPHGVVLGFPDEVWWAHGHRWTESFIDLELEIQGEARCMRAVLTRRDGGRW